MNIEWGSVANWVSGIGSLVASCVALYVADRNHRIKLTGHAGKRVLIGGGFPTTAILDISVTNTGPRPARITNVGFFADSGKGKKWAVIVVGPNRERPWLQSDTLPKQIEDGESAQWQIHLGDEEKWLHDLVDKGMVTSWKGVETLRFVIHTSQGFKKEIRPEDSLRARIHDIVRERSDLKK